MRIGLVLPRPLQDRHLILAKQIGCEEVYTGLPRDQQEPGKPWDFTRIVQLKQRIEDAGLSWNVVETLSVSDPVKRGLPGRDAEIEQFMGTVRNLGAAGIGTAVYTWTTYFSWLRTDHDVPVRGGALATSFDYAKIEDAPLTEIGVVTDDELWGGLQYFLEAVIPVCEASGVKLAMHPDDPPISPIRGVGRIMISPENYQRMIDLVPSPSNGMTFCQGCFTEMGVDVPYWIKHFVGQDRVHFMHYRNLTGDAYHFTEQFHDDGEADMAGHMRAFLEAGYDGPMRPDHTPTLLGDDNSTPGYSVNARLYAVGYVRGMLQACKAAIERGD